MPLKIGCLKKACKTWPLCVLSVSAVIGHQQPQQPQQPDKFTELVNKDNGDMLTTSKFPELLDELHKWSGLHWMECL